MNNERILEKIKKLLVLSKSSNPHEAASALQMAQKLMEKHQLRQSDVEIKEEIAAPLFATRTPDYVLGLIAVIKKAFGCEAYLSGVTKASATFVGEDERPEIAAYCFEVLFRKLAKARKAFSAEQNKRLKRSTLIARADAFCEGWVKGVYKNVVEFAMPPQEKGRLERYLKEKYTLAEVRSRECGKTREHSKLFGENAHSKGFRLGKQVQLHHGVKGSETLKLSVK